MPYPDEDVRQIGAVTGWEGQLKGTLLPVAGAPTKADIESGEKSPIGVLLGPGTYYFYASTAGSAAVDVTLRASAIVGTHAASIYRLLADGATEKMDPAGASAAVAFGALVVGVEQTKSIAGLRGERICVLKLVVNAASSVTLDQAFFNAL